jgi:hypothetical protein
MSNPETVAALISLDLAASDLGNWRLVHDNGRPFTEAETEHVKNITSKVLAEIRRRYESAAALVAENGARAWDGVVKVIRSTPGAVTLGDAERIRGRDWRDLVAEESGLSREEVAVLITADLAELGDARTSGDWRPA